MYKSAVNIVHLYVLLLYVLKEFHGIKAYVLNLVTYGSNKGCPEEKVYAPGLFGLVKSNRALPDYLGPISGSRVEQIIKCLNLAKKKAANVVFGHQVCWNETHSQYI